MVVDDLVFVPNYSTGGTLVLDITGREAPDEVAVRADGPGELDLFLDDGNVVANDPSSNEAVIFSGGTEAVEVTKFDEEVAQNATRPEDTPADLPDPVDPPDPVETDQPDPEPTSTPTGEPTESRRGSPPASPRARPPAARGCRTPPARGSPSPTGTGGPTTTPPPSTTEPPPTTTPPPSTTEPPPTTPPPPSAPAQPAITGVTVGSHANAITFQPGAGGGPVASFELEVASGGGSPRIRQTGANEFTADQLGGCVEHTFVVIAVGTDSQRRLRAVGAGRRARPPSRSRTCGRATRAQSSLTIFWDPPNGTRPARCSSTGSARRR